MANQWKLRRLDKSLGQRSCMEPKCDTSSALAEHKRKSSVKSDFRPLIKKWSSSENYHTHVMWVTRDLKTSKSERVRGLNSCFWSFVVPFLWSMYSKPCLLVECPCKRFFVKIGRHINYYKNTLNFIFTFSVVNENRVYTCRVSTSSYGTGRLWVSSFIIGWFFSLLWTDGLYVHGIFGWREYRCAVHFTSHLLWFCTIG